MTPSALMAGTAAGLIAFGAAGLARGRPSQVPSDLLIRLDRTACFGVCPVYSVTIDSKGNVTYEGSRHVRVEGRQTDRIPSSKVAALVETAERIGFFELQDHYRTIRNADGSETFVTDLPTTFVTITLGGRTKRVEDYFGAPDGLKQLERQIDDAAGTQRWTRTGEPSGDLPPTRSKGPGPALRDASHMKPRTMTTRRDRVQQPQAAWPRSSSS